MSGVPLYSYYGEPATRNARQAYTEGARLAAASAPYVGRGNKCAANEDTCEGRRAMGTNYCYGHARSLGLIKVKEAADGDGPSDAE